MQEENGWQIKEEYYCGGEKMDIKYRRFVIGTKERPTVFLMKSGEVTEEVEYAELFKTIEDANLEIQKCDEPETFKLYGVEISVQGL